MAKGYEPKVGRRFEATDYEGKRSLLREWARTIVAVFALVACLVALAVAGLNVVQTGDGDTLLKVWAVVAMPMTAILTYYFKGSTKVGQDIDESSV